MEGAGYAALWPRGNEKFVSPAGGGVSGDEVGYGAIPIAVLAASVTEDVVATWVASVVGAAPPNTVPRSGTTEVMAGKEVRLLLEALERLLLCTARNDGREGSTSAIR